jgi:hypothetical protein
VGMARMTCRLRRGDIERRWRNSPWRRVRYDVILKTRLAIVALLLAPIAAQARSDFMVFFPWGSTELSAQALQIINQVAKTNSAPGITMGRYLKSPLEWRPFAVTIRDRLSYGRRAV